ncbi:MAG: metalloregulator ArsR/SmtB family transcription factor [Acidimicrobiia bacterium]|nr:metalloregulator ArsR/SmtB family transcription factor [Acidimicrobiia bacterium]
MNTATPARTASDENLDAVFAALGNSTRRALVTRLGAGDATISELAEPFDMTLAAVSKHLLVLERAGLVVRTRRGKARHCRLDANAFETAEKWLGSRREMWESTLDSFADYVEGHHAEEAGDASTT